MEMAERFDVVQVTNTLQLPPSEAFDGLRQVIEQVPSNIMQAPGEAAQDPTVEAASGLLERLAVIEYRIAEVFAQMAGDVPL